MSDTQDLLTIESYSADEFVQLTWEQYGKILDKLYIQISAYSAEHNIKFDAVVPILRGGMMPASYLVGKLKILRVLPVQYKYFVHDKQVDLKKLLPLPDVKLKKQPNILVVENCFCFGTTTQAAVDDVRAKYPDAKIYVAADRMDYSFREIKGVEAVFQGEFNNDCKKLSAEECKKLGIDPTQYYYPWETLDEELAACQLRQYEYGDLKAVQEGAEVAAHFDFSK